MKKIIKCITIFLFVFSLAFFSINKKSAKAQNRVYYEEVNLEKENDKNSEKELSSGEVAGVVICSILVSASIGFSIYWFILREKKEGEKKM